MERDQREIKKNKYWEQEKKGKRRYMVFTSSDVSSWLGACLFALARARPRSLSVSRSPSVSPSLPASFPLPVPVSGYGYGCMGGFARVQTGGNQAYRQVCVGVGVGVGV
jgi:hypothetical protein